MKTLIAKIKGMINAETISYLIFGVLTTLLNLGVFWVLGQFNINLYVANWIAWAVALIFAFITNKLFVFRSKSTRFPLLAREFVSFTLARLLSLGVETLGLFLLVDLAQFDKNIVKIFLNVLVVIINYVLSKLVIFRRNPNQADASDQKTGGTEND